MNRKSKFCSVINFVNNLLEGNISRLLKIMMCTTLLCLWAGVASANVTYNFNAISSQVNNIGDRIINGSLQVTVPTFISSNTIFTPDQLDSFSINTTLGSSFSGVHFYVNYYGPYDVISFGASSHYWNYYFNQGAFASVGNYNTVMFEDQAGHLDITGTSGVPEPTTMLLVGLGLIGVAGIRRKVKV